MWVFVSHAVAQTDSLWEPKGGGGGYIAIKENIPKRPTQETVSIYMVKKSI